METIRVIPRLDVKGPNLVKGIHLEGLRVLGKPEDFAKRYYQDGADELIYIDTVASLYGRSNLLEIVKRTAEHVFIPLTAGGGIRSIDDIRSLLRAGADKVAINTAAIHNPLFIKEAAKTFGSQCIVLSVQAKARGGGEYEALTDNAREKTGKNVYDWVKEAVDLGAGEVLLTSVDREGTGKGYDIELIRKVSESVAVPVIACGGAGSSEHIVEVVKTGKADAICAASVFHYHNLQAVVSTERFHGEGNIEFIKQSRGGINYLKGKMQYAGIRDLKRTLSDSGIPCRNIDFVSALSEN